MSQDGRNTQQSAGEAVRETVTLAAAPPLPVMRTAHVDPDEVAVHATILALVESYAEAVGSPAPWAILLDAAASVPDDHELLNVAAGTGRRLSVTVSDAVADLLTLGLLATGPRGLQITAKGTDEIRAWNGKYSRRLDAASALLDAAQLLPAPTA